MERAPKPAPGLAAPRRPHPCTVPLCMTQSCPTLAGQCWGAPRSAASLLVPNLRDGLQELDQHAPSSSSLAPAQKPGEDLREKGILETLHHQELKILSSANCKASGGDSVYCNVRLQTEIPALEEDLVLWWLQRVL